MQKRKRKSNDNEKDSKEIVRKMLSEMVGCHQIIEKNKGKKNQINMRMVYNFVVQH